MKTSPAGRFLGPALLASALALAIGCGGGDKLYDVSGTANYDGKPIPAGIVYFDPDASAGGVGTQGVANIKDGKYTTAEGGKGVRGGAYVVRASAFDGKPANEAPLGQMLWNGPEYTTKTSLPAQKSEYNIDIPKFVKGKSGGEIIP